MYTVQQIIDIAKISQYLSANDINKKGLWGGGIDLQLPNKIYNIRKSVEWANTYSPNVLEVPAIGYITINNTGDIGNAISVYVNDPELGVLFLGSRVTQAGDSSTSAFAISLTATISTNPYGYLADTTGSTIAITARKGLGSSINGDNRLFVVYANLGIFDNTFDNTFN
jgi:hypothetical protein